MGLKSLAHRAPLWLLVFVAFIGAGALQSLSTNWTRPISEFDEIAHIDNAFRPSQGSLFNPRDSRSQCSKQ